MKTQKLCGYVHFQALYVCSSLLMQQKYFCLYCFKFEILKGQPYWFACYKQTNKQQKRLALVCFLQTNRRGLAWFALYKQPTNQKTEKAWLGSLFTNKQTDQQKTEKALQTNKQQQQKMLGLVCSLQTIKKTKNKNRGGWLVL